MESLSYSADDRRDGIVGLAFAMRHVAQLLLMCDAHDVCVSIDEHTIFIYDNYPSGIGFSRPLFDMHEELLARTRELIQSCPCESGCPSCVGPEGNTGPHAKIVASDILERLTTGSSEIVPF